MKIAEKSSAVLPATPAIALVLGYDAAAYGVDASNISRSDTMMLIRADPVDEDDLAALVPARSRRATIYCPNQPSTARRPRRSTRRTPTAARAGRSRRQGADRASRSTTSITVNFHGFKQIVDKIGGIWLNIDRRYYHVNNGTAAEDYSNINIQPGYQLLDGSDALDFVRFRHTDADYLRIARQQEFVEAFKEQLEQNFEPLDLP